MHFLSSTESGDQDEERGVHALLFVTLYVLDERIVLRIWSSTAWFLHICKIPVSCCFCLVGCLALYLFGAFILLNCQFQIPNGIGTVLGVIQLVLYGYFRKGSREDSLPLLVTHTWAHQGTRSCKQFACLCFLENHRFSYQLSHIGFCVGGGVYCSFVKLFCGLKCTNRFWYTILKVVFQLCC